MKYRKYLLYAAAVFGILALLLTIVPGFQFSIALCIGCGALCLLFWLLTKAPNKTTKCICRSLLALVLAGYIAGCITLGFVISAANPAQLPACRHIVVLGAGVNGTEPSRILRERIQCAYEYLAHNPEAVAVLSGGQGPGEEITEAACMYRELTEMGIPARQLLLEEKSTSTRENLSFSLDVLEEETGSRPNTIGIVSSETHIFRATRFASDLGLEAVGIPAKTTWFPLRVNYYLREVAALWKYWIFGP